MSTYFRHIRQLSGGDCPWPRHTIDCPSALDQEILSSVRFFGNILKFWNDHSSVVRALSIVLGFLPLGAKMGKPRVNYSGQARRPRRYLNCRPFRSYRTKGWLEQGASNVLDYNFKMCWIDEHRHEISKAWSRRYELYMNRLKSGPCAIFRTNLIIVAPYNLPVRSRSSSGPCQCVLGLSRSHLLSLQTLMCYFDTEVNFIAQSSPVSSLLTRTFHGDSRSTYQGLAKGPL